ncbi:hypothetical protein D3C71_1410040 [compost metagenome]
MDAHALAETQGFDFQITFGECDFLGQRDLLWPRQCSAEKVGEIQQQPLGILRSLMHQRSAGVERVEQEMRANAGLQRLQLSLFGADGELAGAPVVLEGRKSQQAERDDDPSEAEQGGEPVLRSNGQQALEHPPACCADQQVAGHQHQQRYVRDPCRWQA